MSEEHSQKDLKRIDILHGIEKIGLGIIVVGTILAAGIDIFGMIKELEITLADLLLLFIYLEVLAMVGHYFASGQLPVRFPLYIAMIALARYLILDMKAMDEWKIIGVSVAILLLALAVLVIRFGHCSFPYKENRLMFGYKKQKAKAKSESTKIPPDNPA